MSCSDSTGLALYSALEYLCFRVKMHYRCFNEESQQRACPCVKVHTDSLKHSALQPLSSCAVADYIEICRVGRLELIKTVLEDQCDPVSALSVCCGLLYSLLFCFYFMSHTFLSSLRLLSCNISKEIFLFLTVTNAIDFFSVFLH